MDQISGGYPEIRHHSSSVGRNLLHLCFKVKYCHPIFNDTWVEKRCEQIFREVSENHNWIVRELGFGSDHVHSVIDAGTKGPEDVAKALKGVSGRKLLAEFPNLKKQYFWGSGFWSPAVYFDSVGERTVDEMDYYVRNQRKERKAVVSKGQSKLDDFAS